MKIRKDRLFILIIIISLIICAVIFIFSQNKPVSNTNKTKENTAVTAPSIEKKSSEATQSEKKESVQSEKKETSRTEKKESTSSSDSTEKKESTVESSTSRRVIDVPTTDEYKIIANKKNALSPTFNPGENSVAKKALLKLIEDMQSLGFKISNSYSGFRSYERQKQLYDNYVKQDGKANADRYSARPGYSEHQTGLAFDLLDYSGQLLGEGSYDSGSIQWLAENAHRYGFVIRYLKGKESITGYMPEPWHIRFIGNDASDVYSKGLTLEEYYGVAGGDYKD